MDKTVTAASAATLIRSSMIFLHQPKGQELPSPGSQGDSGCFRRLTIRHFRTTLHREIENLCGFRAVWPHWEPWLLTASGGHVDFLSIYKSTQTFFNGTAPGAFPKAMITAAERRIS